MPQKQSEHPSRDREGADTEQPCGNKFSCPLTQGHGAGTSIFMLKIKMRLPSALTGDKTEEAITASKMFIDSQQQHFQNIYNLYSGLELIDWGFQNDINLACQYDISTSVPILQDGFFTKLKI